MGNEKQNKMKLAEGTAIRNIKSKKDENREAVWIKKWHLEYEENLSALQIELMKMQQSRKLTGQILIGVVLFIIASAKLSNSSLMALSRMSCPGLPEQKTRRIPSIPDTPPSPVNERIT